MPEENKVSLFKYAMHYGVFLGLFWALKYLVFVAAQSAVPSLIFLYYVLNGGTFLLVYIYYFRFRDANPEKQQSIWHCIGFVIMLCFFASFFEAAMVFIHFQFIDPGYYSARIETTMKAMLEAFPYSEEQRTAVLKIVSNRFVYIVSVFTSNMFVGGILGALLALIIGNKKK